MADKELTIKQQRFVDVYDGDIKKAAEKAGLSYRYCRRLATQRNIKSAIRAREGAKRNKLVLDRTQRQEFWSECIGFDVRKLCNDEGGAKNPNTLDDVSAKTVQSIKFTETVMMEGDDSKLMKRVIEYKLPDRLKASELLGRSNMDFVDKHVHEVQSLADILAVTQGGNSGS
jgi:ribosome assembly protein YihI (activator of Der GTPase)